MSASPQCATLFYKSNIISELVLSNRMSFRLRLFAGQRLQPHRACDDNQHNTTDAEPA